MENPRRWESVDQTGLGAAEERPVDEVPQAVQSGGRGARVEREVGGSRGVGS